MKKKKTSATGQPVGNMFSNPGIRRASRSNIEQQLAQMLGITAMMLERDVENLFSELEDELAAGKRYYGAENLVKAIGINVDTHTLDSYASSFEGERRHEQLEAFGAGLFEQGISPVNVILVFQAWASHNPEYAKSPSSDPEGYEIICFTGKHFGGIQHVIVAEVVRDDEALMTGMKRIKEQAGAEWFVGLNDLVFKGYVEHLKKIGQQFGMNMNVPGMGMPGEDL